MERNSVPFAVVGVKDPNLLYETLKVPSQVLVEYYMKHFAYKEEKYSFYLILFGYVSIFAEDMRNLHWQLLKTPIQVAVKVNHFKLYVSAVSTIQYHLCQKALAWVLEKVYRSELFFTRW